MTPTTEAEDRASRLVWVDTETTGLNPSRERILEIAVIVTDGNLNVVTEGPQLVLSCPSPVLESMSEWCTTQHTASGLLSQCRGSRLNESDASETLLSFLRSLVDERQSPLAGNTVHFDRGFLASRLPDVHKYLHYRNVDVSTVKELVRRWYPDVYTSRPGAEKDSAHRALDDLRQSIAELRHYRQHAFVSKVS